MLVTFLSENLQKTISFLNHAVSLRNQLPILSNFLIQAKNGKLILSATDLEIGIVSEVSANIEKEGEATVPAKSFYDFISSVGSQKLTLESRETELTLKGGRIKASFPVSAAEDFPKLFEKRGEKLLELEKKDIDKYVGRVSFAAAIDSLRPALSGVLIESAKDGLLFVTTDQYRLSYQKTSLKTTGELKKPIVVPARLVKELMFLKAIKICSIFARETANIVRFSIEKEKVTVSANSPSVGEDTVEVDAKTTGEENEIAFNAKYLLDVLSVLDDEEVIFEMNGPLNPGIFRIPEDKNFFHLVMPIRVQT